MSESLAQRRIVLLTLPLPLSGGEQPSESLAVTDALAVFYAKDGRIVINRGEPWEGRARVAEMAAGFFAEVPDLRLVCDELRCARRIAPN